MQNLLDVLDTFCQISGLTVNMKKTKTMAGNKRNTTKTLPRFYIQGETNTSGAKLQIS